jgi:hypothetical protein
MILKKRGEEYEHTLKCVARMREGEIEAYRTRSNSAQRRMVCATTYCTQCAFMWLCSTRDCDLR